MAEYFRGHGSRVRDIETAFNAAGNTINPLVIEIGCGDGRDAKEIIKRTTHYIGFDLSESMIELARRHIPLGKFEVADAITYNYPEGTDIVFAFASLLHLTRPEVEVVFSRVKLALRVGGIFYISSKYNETYKEEVKEDTHGRRMFYFYNPDIFKEIAGDELEVVYEDDDAKGSQPWFQMALKKI